MKIAAEAPTTCAHCGEVFETGQHAWIPAEALNRLHADDPRIEVVEGGRTIARLNGPRDLVLYCRPCGCLCSFMVGLEDDGTVPTGPGSVYTCGGDLHPMIHVHPDVAADVVLE